MPSITEQCVARSLRQREKDPRAEKDSAPSPESNATAAGQNERQTDQVELSDSVVAPLKMPLSMRLKLRL